MKIYFLGSIAQKPKFGTYYSRIVNFLLGLKLHEVQYEHILSKTMSHIMNETEEEVEAYYKKAVKNISQTDIVVAEASFPSTLNVGHEITLALEKEKPVIVLYKKGHSSFFLRGMNSDRAVIVEYDDSNLEQVLQQAIEYAKDAMSVRFNFFVTPRHLRFLDWIAKHKDLPRAVYLRKLMDKDIKNHKDFPG